MVRMEVMLGIILAAALAGTIAFTIATTAPSTTTTSSSTTSTTTTTSTTVTTSTSTTTWTSSTSTQGQGTVNGTVSIGPLRPVCLVNATSEPPPSGMESIKAVITPSSGTVTVVPLEWTMYSGCEARASFNVALRPGGYSLSLSKCTYMGCSYALPKQFSVYANKTTVVDVSIDTGIR